MKHLNPEHFYLPYNDPGNSSFALPFVCKRREDMLKLKTIFDELQIEYRPIVSGNLLLHPFLKNGKIVSLYPMQQLSMIMVST